MAVTASHRGPLEDGSKYLVYMYTRNSDGSTWNTVPSTIIEGSMDKHYAEPVLQLNNGRMVVDPLLYTSGDAHFYTANRISIPQGEIYSSTDKGETWSVLYEKEGMNWRYMAMDSTGYKIVAVTYPASAGVSPVYISFDKGSSWQKAKDTNGNALKDASWDHVAMSSDGSVVVASMNDGSIRSEYWKSVDGGQSFKRNFAKNMQTVALDSTGSKLFLGVSDPSSCRLRVMAVDSWQETNVGTTMATALKRLSVYKWKGGTGMSTDGKTLVVMVNKDEYVYVSKNFGKTWTRRNLGGTSMDYDVLHNGIHVTPNGETIHVTLKEKMFVSKNSGESFQEVVPSGEITSWEHDTHTGFRCDDDCSVQLKTDNTDANRKTRAWYTHDGNYWVEATYTACDHGNQDKNIAVSGDGKKMIVMCPTSGSDEMQIWYSNDQTFGTDWATNKRTWTNMRSRFDATGATQVSYGVANAGVYMSGDGTKIWVMRSGMLVYSFDHEHDFQTWTKKSGFPNNGYMTCVPDASVCVASGYDFAGSEKPVVEMSKDYGLTWTIIKAATADDGNYWDVEISQDGSRIVSWINSQTISGANMFTLDTQPSSCRGHLYIEYSSSQEEEGTAAQGSPQISTHAVLRAAAASDGVTAQNAATSATTDESSTLIVGKTFVAPTFVHGVSITAALDGLTTTSTASELNLVVKSAASAAQTPWYTSSDGSPSYVTNVTIVDSVSIASLAAGETLEISLDPVDAVKSLWIEIPGIPGSITSLAEAVFYTIDDLYAGRDAMCLSNGQCICSGGWTGNTCNVPPASFGLGNTKEKAALGCLNILNSNPNAKDGAYWIKTNASEDAFKTWCDMTTDGGGWTLVSEQRAGADRSQIESTGLFVSDLAENTVLVGNDDFVYDALATTEKECKYLCLAEPTCNSMEMVLKNAFMCGCSDAAALNTDACGVTPGCNGTAPPSNPTGNPITGTTCRLSTKKSTDTSMSVAKVIGAAWPGSGTAGYPATYSRIDRNVSINPALASMCQAGAVGSLTVTDEHKINGVVAKLSDGQINNLLQNGDTNEIMFVAHDLREELFALHQGSALWKCETGSGEQFQYYMQTDKASEAECSAFCQSETLVTRKRKCKGFDYSSTATTAGTTCRLYSESKPRWGDAGSDGRRYCEKTLDWVWECSEGVGSQEIETFSDGIDQEACTQKCHENVDCMSYDWLSTMCNLYGKKVVPTIGSNADGKVYCYRRWVTSPQDYKRAWSKTCAVRLDPTFTWSSAVGGTLPTVSDFVARADGMFVNCFDGVARTLNSTTVSTDTCGLGIRTSVAGPHRISIGCSSDATNPNHAAWAHCEDQSAPSAPSGQNWGHYFSDTQNPPRFSVHGINKITTTVHRNTDRWGWGIKVRAQMDPQGIEQNHYLIDNLFDGSIGSSAHPNPTGCKTSSKNYLLHNFVFLPYHFNSTLFFFFSFVLLFFCSFVFFCSFLPFLYHPHSRHRPTIVFLARRKPKWTGTTLHKINGKQLHNVPIKSSKKFGDGTKFSLV